MDVPIKLKVNGKEHDLQVEAKATLLEVLREQLKIKSVHRSCQEGECGVCTVLLNGEPITSCLMLAVQANGCNITTVEGLLGEDGSLHPLMKSFVENHGFQCGYCTSGFLLTAYALLNQSEKPTQEEIRKSIEGNLCRCTGYVNIVKSIEAAAEEKRAGDWW